MGRALIRRGLHNAVPVGFLKRVFSPLAPRRPEQATAPAAAATSKHTLGRKDALPHRKSMGLSHFLGGLPNQRRLEVLDLGGICEFNVNFLSRRGCRIHAEDLLADFDQVKAQLPGRRFQESSAKQFVEEYLRFPPARFDALFVWDCLEHLEDPVLDLAVTRLEQILRPGGALLAFFHTQSRGDPVELHRYEIENEQTLRLRVRQTRVLPVTFNNRGLERLFSGFASVKFFLTRDNLREVIVTR